MTDELIAGMLFGMLFSVLLFVFTPVSDRVYPEDYNYAWRSCLSHGGLSSVERRTYVGTKFEAHCLDGTDIVLRNKKENP